MTADQKSLFKIVNSLMNKPKNSILPSYDPLLRSWLTDSVSFLAVRYISKIHEDLFASQNEGEKRDLGQDPSKTSGFTPFKPVTKDMATNNNNNNMHVFKVPVSKVAH